MEDCKTYDEVQRGMIDRLLWVLDDWQTEIVDRSDMTVQEIEEEVDTETAVEHYMALQFGLSMLTIDSYYLDDETLKYLKDKFSFCMWTYKIYMRHMFYRSNSPYFDKIFSNEGWYDGFDIEKERSKPFAVYHDWLQEKDEDGKTNYERYLR